MSDAERRVLEGKLVDAVWHAMTDPLKHTEAAAAEAVMESSLLNNLAAAGATVYGGPGGAAAYAAWVTYKTTGNLEAALKAGAIAWATSKGLKLIDGMPSETFTDSAKRTLAAASIGGAAVAASGGTDEQVLAAFGRGAILATAREVYRGKVGKDIEGQPAKEQAVAKLDADGRPRVGGLWGPLKDSDGNLIRDSSGNAQIDIAQMPREISHVGIATSEANLGYWGAYETNGVMQDLGKLPYMNDMAYFHDQWMATAQAEGVVVQVTILPAIALVAAGSEPSVTQAATNATIEDDKDKAN